MGAGGGPPCHEGALHATPQRDSQNGNFRPRVRYEGVDKSHEGPHHRVRDARIGLVRERYREKVSTRMGKHPLFLLIFALRRAPRGSCELLKNATIVDPEPMNVITTRSFAPPRSTSLFRVDLGSAWARKRPSATRFSTCWPARCGVVLLFLARAAVAQRARSQPTGGRGCSFQAMKEGIGWAYPVFF